MAVVIVLFVLVVAVAVGLVLLGDRIVRSRDDGSSDRPSRGASGPEGAAGAPPPDRSHPADRPGPAESEGKRSEGRRSDGKGSDGKGSDGSAEHGSDVPGEPPSSASGGAAPQEQRPSGRPPTLGTRVTRPSRLRGEPAQPLEASTREHYLVTWQRLRGTFDASPREALAKGDQLVRLLLDECGYRVQGDQVTAPDPVAQRYQAARLIAVEAGGTGPAGEADEAGNAGAADERRIRAALGDLDAVAGWLLGETSGKKR